MHKRLKILINNIQELFSIEFLNRLGKKTGFIRRRSKITAETFLSFNTFSSSDMCDKSLSTLCGRLAAQHNISISPQALNERFNQCSVNFMQEVFNIMMMKQNKILNCENSKLNFNRILVNDATSYKLPEKFCNEFKGAGGVSSKSAIKIQLQYDLLSGKFICCDTYSGTSSDSKYVEVMDNHTKAGDLRLSDLGYYKVDYLKKIDDKKAFFISKLKSTSTVYKKNPFPILRKNGTIVKSTEYIKIDIFEIIKPLADGETIEIKDIYIGSKKELKSRLIITKLSEENKQKRKIKHLASVRRGRGKITDRSMAWTEINVYITNVPEKILATEQIHDVYSLRWQIEIMFKVWKSIFNINNVKNVKIERFKCFLYGRLIALLLSSSIVFTSRDIIYEEDSKEISELKSFYQVHEFFTVLKTEIFKGEISILTLLKKIINAIRRFGIKSRKKGCKNINEILEYLKISNTDLVNMVI
jgi:hypothetical protein